VSRETVSRVQACLGEGRFACGLAAFGMRMLLRCKEIERGHPARSWKTDLVQNSSLWLNEESGRVRDASKIRAASRSSLACSRREARSACVRPSEGMVNHQVTKDTKGRSDFESRCSWWLKNPVRSSYLRGRPPHPDSTVFDPEARLD
jgi:hypothetical protein